MVPIPHARLLPILVAKVGARRFRWLPRGFFLWLLGRPFSSRPVCRGIIELIQSLGPSADRYVIAELESRSIQNFQVGTQCRLASIASPVV